MRQVRGDPGLGSVVVIHRYFNIEMMPDGVFDPGEGSIVKERRLQRRIAKRGTAELVTVVRVAGNLLQAKVLILVRTIKNHVPQADTKQWGDLRNTDVMHLEVAEHLIGVATYAVTRGAPSFAKENQSTSLLGTHHRVGVAAGKFVERRVCIDLSKFKFSNGATEHREVDRSSRGYFREECAKDFAVDRVAVKTPM